MSKKQTTVPSSESITHSAATKHTLGQYIGVSKDVSPSEGSFRIFGADTATYQEASELWEETTGSSPYIHGDVLSLRHRQDFVVIEGKLYRRPKSKARKTAFSPAQLDILRAKLDEDTIRGLCLEASGSIPATPEETEWYLDLEQKVDSLIRAMVESFERDPATAFGLNIFQELTCAYLRVQESQNQTQVMSSNFLLNAALFHLGKDRLTRVLTKLVTHIVQSVDAAMNAPSR